MRDDSGQSAILMVIGMAAAIFFAVGLARVGVAMVQSARADTAADAAALGGAWDGIPAAGVLAQQNGAKLTSVLQIGSELEVTVSVGGSQSKARARRFTPQSSVDRAGLTIETQEAIARAESVLGVTLPIVSGFRSREQQQALWDARDRNPYPVARPGTSRHESGKAIDVPSNFAPRLARIGPMIGLCRPLPRRDPIHFELCPTPPK
ncbi:MAG: M15 family metallopeptidase [Acidimicrobiales bacterium]